MGIKGLLPFLKKASTEVDIKNFSGVTVAVDAYCWLHKGAFSCAEKLGKGEPTNGYVHYCMKMVNMLLAAGIKPILVFDGQNLPSKSATEAKRRENRDKYRKMAKQFLREGKLKEAKDCFQQTVDITPEMAHELILACRKRSVDCIVAPYEADAQLAYLALCGIAQIVITEDSDLVVFGCDRVIFKLDMFGRGVMVERLSIAKCFGARAENFTFEKFRYMCILSGCDYLPSLPGIGLAKSCKFFNLIVNPDVYKALSKLPSYLKMPNLVVTTEYKNGFVRANNTFLYQLVFCPLVKRLVPLHPYPLEVDPEELTYSGNYFTDDVALQLAMGNLHFQTKKPFDDKQEVRKEFSLTWEQRESKENQSSIWDSNYKVDKNLAPEKPKTICYSTHTKGTSVTLCSEKIFKEIFSPQKRVLLSSDILTEKEIEETLTDSFSLPASKKSNANCSTHWKNSLNESDGELEFVEQKCSTEIVRSRFFANSSSSKATENSPRTLSWLDTIDTEYGMENSQSQTRSLNTCSKSPFATLDKKIMQAKQHTGSPKAEYYIDKPAITTLGECTVETNLPVNKKENLHEMVLSSHPEKIGIHKFNWSKNISSGLVSSNNLKLQNSSTSKFQFKPVVPKRPVCSSKEPSDSTAVNQTLLSQYSICSSDDSHGKSIFSDSTNLIADRKENYQLIGSNRKVCKKGKPFTKNKLSTSSRCSGLRKRVTQVSITDMINKFSFEHTQRITTN